MVITQAIERILPLYPEARVPRVGGLLDRFSETSPSDFAPLIDHICRYRVQQDSDPGIPLRSLGREKSAVYADYRRAIIAAVYERIRLLLAIPIGDLRETPATSYWRFVRDGLVDPVRLFIKNEPHKRSKILRERLRFISNVSLIDEIIDRLLFSDQNEEEISAWDRCPSKPGIGFTDESIELLHNNVMGRQCTHPVAEGDSSAWDWTVQGWELWAEARMRVELMGMPEDSPIARLIHNRFTMVACKTFVLSDGTMISQPAPGIMPSGWYCTSSSNSRMVVLSCSICESKWTIAMGDDFITDLVKNFRERFEALGHTLKVYKPIDPENYEFCSTIYPSGQPVNIWKTFVRLLSHSHQITFEGRLALYAQWYYEMRHSPKRELLSLLISQSTFLGSERLVANASPSPTQE